MRAYHLVNACLLAVMLASASASTPCQRTPPALFSRERIAYPSCRESSPGASSQGVPEPEGPGRVHRRHEARHAVYVPRQPYIRPLNRTMR